MSLPISGALKAWKSAETRTDPLINLYDVEITDALTIYLIAGAPAGTPTLDYGGNTYNASYIVEDEVEQTIEYELQQKRLAISNIDGIAGGYIETYELDGRQVTIRRMLLSALREGPTDDDIIVETWTILSQTYDRHVATVTLGPPPLFERRCPWRRFNRQRCGWQWERRYEVDNECHYPSDEFTVDTPQDFLVGSDDATEQVRQFGWYSLNMATFRAACTAPVADVAQPQGYEIEGDAESFDWSVDDQTAPFVFKLFEGDFDVSTKVTVTSAREGLFAGILCQERGDDHDSWVMLGLAIDADLTGVSVEKSAEDGVAQVGTADDEKNYFRMRRVGNVFTLYTSADGETWSQLAEHTLTLQTEARLGLVLACAIPSTATGGAVFDYFRFTAGGDDECDRTLEDCMSKGNAHRHFAFPGIPEK